MSSLNPLLWPKPPVIWGYGIAVLSVTAALTISRWPALHLESAPVSLFLSAVILSAWFGGLRPSLLATVLSVAAFNYCFLPPIYSLGPKPGEIPRLIIFTVSALLVASLSAAGRQAMDSLTCARDELTEKVQRLRSTNEALQEESRQRNSAEKSLRRSEGYLAEAQRLSHTGSFGWKPSIGEITWSEETYRIFQYDRTTKPTVELVLQRVHPEDAALVRQTIERAAQDQKDFEHEYRLVMPDHSVKRVHVAARAISNETSSIEFVGAVMDVTEAKEAFEKIKILKDQLYRENLALKEDIDQASMFEEIVGISPALRTVLSHISKVAPTDSTVLITGETGTGKELFARAVHKRSQRSSRAFVSVNCAAIPRDLIASELFGHEKGAFTGAAQRRLGRFELAEGGTIFLDEIGELPAETQIALLRVLQEHEFQRVGGTGTIRTNVRVIAATNRDLQAAIAGGTFRSDLFYRLNVFPIEVPPLRERREDIPVLVEYFIDRFARKAGKSIRGVNKKSLELLQSYPWPGNIRELQNVIERTVILCDTENFSVDESWLSRQTVATEPNKELGLFKRLPSQEKAVIEAALRESGGRVSGPAGAAAKLGIPGSTLDSKIRSLKINKNRFKTTDPSPDRV